jgi:hypothetical protein
MAFLEVAVLPLRAVQALFSIIVLGLTAYLVDAWSNPWDSWSPHSEQNPVPDTKCIALVIYSNSLPTRSALRQLWLSFY